MAKHYILVNKYNYITSGISDSFLHPHEGAICINENGDRHFSINEVANPLLFNENGTPIYKLIGGIVERRSEKEVESDVVAIIPDTPSLEKLQADLDYLSMMMGIDL